MLSMYILLHLGVNSNNPSIEIRVLPHHHITIPRHCHENRVNSTAQRRHENLAYLQPDQEAECKHNGRECPAFVVGWVGELEVEEGEEGTEIGDEGGAHGEDGGY